MIIELNKDQADKLGLNEGQKIEIINEKESTLPNVDKDFLKGYKQIITGIFRMSSENEDKIIASFIKILNNTMFKIEQNLVKKYGWKK